MQNKQIFCKQDSTALSHEINCDYIKTLLIKVDHNQGDDDANYMGTHLQSQ